MHYYILIPAVFLIAACYSSVGLGGGTAYLSVISFFSGDPDLLRPTAWALNVIAGTIGVRNFHRAGHLRLCEALPYVLGGVAGAIVGALLPIHPTAFRGLLGTALVVVALLMFLRRAPNSPAETTFVRRQRWAVPLVCGGSVGLASGMIGIGGGILLGPLILTFNLGEAKPTAALTSLYTLLSSAAALGAHLAQGGPLNGRFVLALSGAVIVGAYLGSHFGARKASATLIRRVFGVVVLVAGVRLLVVALNG